MTLSKAILALAVGLVACTPAAQKAVGTVVEAACVAVVSIEAPGDEPLCVFAEELTVEVEAYIAGHAGASPTVTTSGATTVVGAEVYKRLAARPAIAARRARRVGICHPVDGQVAP